MQTVLRSDLAESLHKKALEISGRYLRAEAELIEVLQQVDQYKVYLSRGHSSLFLYVIEELSLSESVAYNLIAVARKAREVPELKAEIQKGAITLSNARKITPVLTAQNKTEWLKKASELSQRQLEKEIVKVRPQSATPERASYVTPSRVRLEMGLSEKDMLQLRRAQDLLSQMRKRAVTLEETVIMMTHEFLERRDPVARAKRQQVRKGLLKPDSKEGLPLSAQPVALQVRGPHSREPIPAAILHQVNLRDQRRCMHKNSTGVLCNQTRFIEIHHIKPVSEGGRNTLENLATLCSAHHRWEHGS